MLKSLIIQASRFLSIPTNNPELLKAQFKVFSSQIPLMYGILLINAWALTLTFLNTAPLWLSLYIPIAFTVLCGIRLIGWWRARNVTPTAKIAHKALSQTNRISGVIVAALSAWALSLFPYADHYMQGNIAFFIAITGVGVIICLQQLRSTAFIVTIAINVPFVVFFYSTGVPSFIGIAINMMLVSVALLLVVIVQSRYFTESVDAQTMLAAANKENFRLANLDSLTGLNNRRQFFSHLSSLFTRASDNQERLAVGIVDLDGFKPVNDLYGHAVGDSLLIEVGKRLNTLADDKMSIFRLGGDEFALTIIDCVDDEYVLSKGNLICRALRDPFVLADATIQISGSLGFAVYPELANDANELYERADYALYHSKREKRGEAVLFSDKHIVEIEQSTTIEQVLSKADLKEELSVFFQPIVDVHLKKIVAFEALARWNSPVLGNVQPAHFIPVAERAGIVSKLTRVLFQKALATALTWPNDITLSFNLSTHDISSTDGVERIVDIIETSGFAPSRIDLEITETAMMYDFSQAKKAIKTLKALGCGVALDDFGTGFSSLSQLHALPLTKIKIDRSFVSDLDKIPASYKIVKSLLALSRDMELDCVIEGVETQGEMDALGKLDGQLVQGYFYSRPLPEAELGEILSRFNSA